MSEEEKYPKNFWQKKVIWLVGIVMVVILGWLFWQFLFGEGEYRVTLVHAPTEATASRITTFTWRIDGPATTINQTTVYYGLDSQPGVLEKSVKPTETKYTDFVKDFVSGKYDIPLQFIGNTRIDKPGKYYFRVYALIKGKNYWSDEYTLEVKPAGDYEIKIIDAPKEITAGEVATFTWNINGTPTTINHTAVYLGTKSTPGKLEKTIRPNQTTYTDFVKDFVSGKYDIPLQFIGNIKIATPGAYFYRAYALIEGKNYWTDEGILEVKE